MHGQVDTVPKGVALVVLVRASLRVGMLKRETLPIDNIYVPSKRRATLKPEHVLEIAESMLANGQETPILVRLDGARYVLVEGLHRLEAAKALGEKTIFGYLVQAAKH
jgi:sulfiredoxin